MGPETGGRKTSLENENGSRIKGNHMLKKMIEILIEERNNLPPLNKSNLSDPDYFRALTNIRPPALISEEFLTLQDKYLKKETEKRGVIQTEGLKFHNQIALWQGDITRIACDAIVNAGNSALLGCFQPLHNCIDNVIHSCAGIQVRLDCDKIMQDQHLPNGEVVVTPAYNLPSKYIFHTVGPVVRVNQPSNQDISDLRKCYLSCLHKASELRLQHIAFCCLSTGVFGYPQDQAANVAVEVVREWLNDNGGLQVIFNVFLDKDRLLYEQELSG